METRNNNAPGTRPNASGTGPKATRMPPVVIGIAVVLGLLLVIWLVSSMFRGPATTTTPVGPQGTVETIPDNNDAPPADPLPRDP